MQDALKMDLEKVKTIVEWPTLKSVFEVRKFHGIVNFYLNFIYNLNDICAPLTESMEKGNFQWTLTSQ
jgi:hypothetical protein